MGIRNGMNRELGTKWFTFFTKVRPGIALIFFVISLVDIAQFPEVYFANALLVLSLVLSVAQLIIQIMIMIKAEDDYRDFLRFLNGALIVDAFNAAFQAGVQQYYTSNLETIEFVLVVGILWGIMMLLWYLPNIKYFRRRLLPLVEGTPNVDFINSTEQSAKRKENDKYVISFCRMCGAKITEESRFCSMCGTEVIKESLE